MGRLAPSVGSGALCPNRADESAVSRQAAPGLEQEQEPGTGAGGPLVFTAAEAFSCAVQIVSAFSPSSLPYLQIWSVYKCAASQWN